MHVSIRWLDIHPLNSPHVSDFIAGLCIPSSSHNKGILLHQSCHNLSYDHGCPPKIIKTQAVVTEHICIIQALFSPYTLLCDLIWAQHTMVWLQFVRLSYFLPCVQDTVMENCVGKKTGLIFNHNHLLTPCLSLRCLQEGRQ